MRSHYDSAARVFPRPSSAASNTSVAGIGPSDDPFYPRRPFYPEGIRAGRPKTAGPAPHPTRERSLLERLRQLKEQECAQRAKFEAELADARGKTEERILLEKQSQRNYIRHPKSRSETSGHVGRKLLSREGDLSMSERSGNREGAEVRWARIPPPGLLMHTNHHAMVDGKGRGR